MLVVSGALFWPVVFGDFMLDDFGNLPPLYQNMELLGFWAGVTSGESGPLGRPLSLLTFAVQQGSWPDPYWFKFVNVVLHSINGCLVYILLYMVFSHLKLQERRHNNIIFFAALLWVISPLSVSTVGYVVQRMVLLSSLFVLLALISYVYGRKLIVAGREKLGVITAFSGLVFFGGGAVFSKESGLLLAAYVLVLEMFFIKVIPLCKVWFSRCVIFGSSCVLLLFAIFLLYKVPDFFEQYQARGFSMLDRVLTQPAVLLDYIRVILFPSPSLLGLFHDDYPISVLGDLKTTASLLFLLSLFVLVVISYLKGYFLIFISISWFFAGHLMESSIVPLELYFEHRNYLPMLSIYVFLVSFIYFLSGLTESPIVKAVVLTGGTGYVLAFSGVTLQQSSLWGDPVRYGYIQSVEHPKSIRARSLMIHFHQQLGDIDSAYSELKALRSDFPGEIELLIMEIEYACYDEKKFDMPDVNEHEELFRTGRYSASVLKEFNDLREMIELGQCDDFTLVMLNTMIEKVKDNAYYKRKMPILLRTQALIAMSMKDVPKAIVLLKEINSRSFDDSMMLARLLAVRGEYALALSEINDIKNKINLSYSYMKKRSDVEDLERAIRVDREEILLK